MSIAIVGSVLTVVPSGFHDRVRMVTDGFDVDWLKSLGCAGKAGQACLEGPGTPPLPGGPAHRPGVSPLKIYPIFRIPCH